VLPLAVACALLSCADVASAACERPIRWSDLQPTLGVRIDNDALGGDGQDVGYTSGLQVTLRSGNLQGFAQPDCLPLSVRSVNGVVDWLYPAGLDQKNVLFSVFHGVYTPADGEAVEPIANDRPYAAALLLGAGYSARRGDSLHNTQLRLGIVGPSAKGEQLQNGVHKIIGAKQSHGWQNQLHDEPVLQLLHERLHRMEFASVPWGFESDLIGHWGGSLGNFATYANAGAEWRFGRNLSTDFGTDPLRTEGENVARGIAPPQRWAWHVFLSFDARAVAHNITLDGNTLGADRSVDRVPWLGEYALGVGARVQDFVVEWRATTRSREYRTGQPAHAFSTIYASYELPAR